jgi:hypothetical protein
VSNLPGIYREFIEISFDVVTEIQSKYEKLGYRVTVTPHGYYDSQWMVSVEIPSEQVAA